MTSEAGARPRSTHAVISEADAVPEADVSMDAVPAGAPTENPDRAATEESPGRTRRWRGGRADRGDEPARGRLRFSVPLLPVLAGVLVLLLAGVAVLWLSRPEPSAVRTADYVQALQAARSGVVDVTSFDYLTLDDDIEQIRRVTTGDLRDESVAQLESRRQELTAAEAVVNTEVVGAGVTRADESAATVLLVIQSTQQTSASAQSEVVKYRIQVELAKRDGRWLLSGISGR